VTRYFPDFAAHHKDQTRVLHLFTHTSGLPDMLPNNLELRAQHAPLSQFLEHAVRDTVPLFPAGTSLSYQSMGTLLVAAIVEKVSGLSLPEFLRQELFAPLGMDSTSLGAGSLARDRLVRVRLPAEQEGTNYHWNTAYWQELGAPWGGLFSTPEDFAALCQMMLDRGRASGRQLVSPRTIERMTSNRLDDQPDLPEAVRRSRPWGLGWRLNHPGMPDSWGDLLSDRTYGHVGATGTMVWIDPAAEAFFILFTTAPLEQSHWRLVRISNVVAASLL
jgi:CubicO group peptidase (beta-lactamase class C family)